MTLFNLKHMKKIHHSVVDFFDSLSIVLGDLSLRLGMFGEENQVVSYE